MADKNDKDSWSNLFKEIFTFELVLAMIDWIGGAAKMIYRIVIIGFLLLGAIAVIWEKFFK